MTVTATVEDVAMLVRSVFIYEVQHCPYRE